MATPAPTERELLAVLGEHGHPATAITALPGDVSARCYFRVARESGGSAILAWYPEALRPACERFEQTTRLLEGISVAVPGILFSDAEAGLMLLEDLGPTTLYDLRDQPWPELALWLEQAAVMAREIARLPAEAVSRLNPPLDQALLRAELEKTWNLVFEPSGPLPGSLPPRLGKAISILLEVLTAEPPRPCHRDYMARNLVPVGTRPGLAVIDHQDLRLGPATYDLASLLNDSLYAPVEIERRLVGLFLPEERHLDYHRAAAQRTLKALGTFLAFAAKGNRRHLSLVHSSLLSARRHLVELPECQPAKEEIRDLWAHLEEQLPGMDDLLD